jgi:hypothetical protein
VSLAGARLRDTVRTTVGEDSVTGATTAAAPGMTSSAASGAVGAAGNWDTAVESFMDLTPSARPATATDAAATTGNRCFMAMPIEEM